MRSILLIPLCLGLVKSTATAQTVLNNVSHFVGSSDNTGLATHQPGTEVLSSAIGGGVRFAAGGSFEHIGQFYVAKDGIWNGAGSLNTDPSGTDYFGYAPKGVGSYQPYQGSGIQGASSVNGGFGTGQPTFGHLQLNSTGEFPVAGGMWVMHSLSFNANGPGQSTIITTPNALSSRAEPVVSFGSEAIITGANEMNYINGFARVINPKAAFTFPLGYPQQSGDSFHPLTINQSIQGSITARYLPQLQHPITARGEQISDVFPVGNWQIDAPAGTSVTVSLPTLFLSTDAIAFLRLIGWNGKAWVDLSGPSTPRGCVIGDCQLTGTLTDSITDLAIGLSGRTFLNEDSPALTVWPNPTRGRLTLHLAKDEPIREVRILDLTGQLLGLSSTTSAPSVVDATLLPSGSYIVEAQTVSGQTVRRRFIKQ